MNAVVPDMQRHFTLDALFSDCPEMGAVPDLPVGRLRTDSRSVEPGDVFFALPGCSVDGRDYIDEALGKGAGAVLYEQRGTDRASQLVEDVPVLGVQGLRKVLGKAAARYFGFPSQSMCMVGVTGTNGKTTTAYLVAQALDRFGLRCAYSGTIGLGMVDEALETTSLTTLDSIDLHQMMAQCRSKGAQAMALEVSSHGLDQGRTEGAAVRIGVLTNLTRDHLDYHQTMQQYKAAKRKLFENDALEIAVVNRDDAFGREILQLCRNRKDGPRCVTFGSTAEADLYPENIRCSSSGIEFDIRYQGTTLTVRSALLGRVNVLNLVAVIGVLLALDLPSSQVEEALDGLRPPPGRMEVFRGKPSFPPIVVDYAHTPDALEQALISIREICQGKLVAVFGCGGDRDQSKRAMMGKVAERFADTVILTDDNPRSEPAEAITREIAAAMQIRPQVIHDRIGATRHAISACGENDIILLAGKGHEQTQTVQDEVRHLCDREFVPRLLGGWK